MAIPRARALVLSAVAVVTLGAWAALGNGTDPAAVALKITDPDPEPRRPVQVAPPNPLVTPTGDVITSMTARPAEFVAKKALPEAEVAVLAAAGVARIRGVVAKDGDLITGTWQFTVNDSADPAAALAAIDKLYADAGFEQAVRLDTPGVRVRRTLPQSESATIRVHYVHGRSVLRVESYGPDRAKVDEGAELLLRRQLERTPAAS